MLSSDTQYTHRSLVDAYGSWHIGRSMHHLQDIHVDRLTGFEVMATQTVTQLRCDVMRYLR